MLLLPPLTKKSQTIVPQENMVIQIPNYQNDYKPQTRAEDLGMLPMLNEAYKREDNFYFRGGEPSPKRNHHSININQFMNSPKSGHHDLSHRIPDI